MPEQPPAARVLAGDRVRAPAGRGRLLAAVYTFFALAAGSRAVVELALSPSRAPLAYVLSAVSAAFYLLGAVAFRRPGSRARRVALGACAFELAGVLVIGTLTAGDPARWGDETVWSAYGSGYGCVPLLLPALGLWHLRRSTPGPAAGP